MNCKSGAWMIEIVPMRNRTCPFCGSVSQIFVGIRTDIWVRCRDCRSMFRDITLAEFSQLHYEAFQDDEFIEASTAVNGLSPSTKRWDSLSLAGTSVLEIGPGAGQLLAAARKDGRHVAAVESSAVHRAFIRESWGIDEVYASFDELPEGSTFDLVIGINVFEHIYDIMAFLRSVRGLLVPGGTLFISTPNATSLEAHVLKTWWSMCKVHDHVRFPSREGLTTAAQTAGLQVKRIWSGSLPFEFPISALTSARDCIAARGISTRDQGIAEHDPAAIESVGKSSNSAKSRIARFYAVAESFDPTARLLTALGRGEASRPRSSGRTDADLHGALPPWPRLSCAQERPRPDQLTQMLWLAVRPGIRADVPDVAALGDEPGRNFPGRPAAPAF